MTKPKNEDPIDAITEDDVREAALLAMSWPDAAVSLGVSNADFARLMGRPKMAAAWVAGRRKLERSLHAALIRRAMEGSVPAFREVQARIDHDPPLADQDVVADDDDADAPPKPIPFADVFEQAMARRKANGA